MLVHPSRTTQEHFQYFQNIQAIKDDWARILALPETDPDRRELIQTFAEAHRSLMDTVGPSLPPFQAIAARLGGDIASTQVREVNRRRGNRSRDINWRHSYAWILVGGQAMDRGFTVRELTVTYMPRGIGTGNADTLQQRARFLGYKRHYLGYCRIYVEAAALGAFEAYVTHEEEMRAELQGIRDRGEPLSNWKRRFILSEDLNPCRTSVIQQDILRGNYADSWFFPRMLKMSDLVLQANRDTCEAFCRGLDFALDDTFTQPAQQHQLCDDVPLHSIIDDLLLHYRVEDHSDTESFLGMMLQLSQALKANRNETVRVYRMRPNYPDAKRRLDGDGKIASIRRLQQGPTRSGAGYSYPGDHAFRDPNRISVQIHLVDLTEENQQGHEVVVRQGAAVPALWIPQRMSLDWIVQDQAART